MYNCACNISVAIWSQFLLHVTNPDWLYYCIAEQLSENNLFFVTLVTGDYFKTSHYNYKKLDYRNDAAILYWPLAHGAILQMTALTEPIRRAIF